jgi:uncharacterized DUF497 family protein
MTFIKLIFVYHRLLQNDKNIRIIADRRAIEIEQKEYKGYLI